MEDEYLDKCAITKAAACIVLCDKFSTDPDVEDASNIMRVISVKNYNENTRCIIQLIHYSSKVRFDYKKLSFPNVPYKSLSIIIFRPS